MPEHHDPLPPLEDPEEFWQRRYSDKPRVWSGRVNSVLAELAAPFTPGRVLDLGCGEGGDSLWLAAQGWEVTAVDISSTAIERGRAAATALGIDPGRIHWVAADLAGWTPETNYELVSACFLQSPVELDRSRALTADAADRIVAGGHLLVVSHAAPPPWASQLAGHQNHNTFLTPDEEIQALGLREDDWEPVMAGTRPRAATDPDGKPAALDDAIVLLRRR